MLPGALPEPMEIQELGGVSVDGFNDSLLKNMLIIIVLITFTFKFCSKFLFTDQRAAAVNVSTSEVPSPSLS